ncbi:MULTISPECIES: hypothetical protein [unclassified Chryseobacterium]|uniref:hypothetical protein n=1 Tax=unclassified Chryseobacterium TaxID=2593645 RepID=UPI002269DAF9|nr:MULTISPECIES: hypothetical protein [unclassified Chryseobacterium]
MKTLISTLVTLGYISAIIAIVSLAIVIIKKCLYYPSDIRREATEKTTKIFYIAGCCMVFSSICFLGAKEIVKYDFKRTLKQHTIISVDIENIFFSQNDIEGVFDHFETDEGRYRCESFTAIINLDDNESIPIEIIRHCYEKNRYIIISKQYSLDSTIGDIRTDKFNHIQKDTITQ